ncbi:MAG: hypothetical protein MZV63_60160 [Marinilabiliales bacterium]|nr:hypothetical protein [Marinilabiliales bacterium]
MAYAVKDVPAPKPGAAAGPHPGQGHRPVLHGHVDPQGRVQGPQARADPRDHGPRGVGRRRGDRRRASPR